MFLAQRTHVATELLGIFPGPESAERLGGVQCPCDWQKRQVFSSRSGSLCLENGVFGMLSTLLAVARFPALAIHWFEVLLPVLKVSVYNR